MDCIGYNIQAWRSSETRAVLSPVQRYIFRELLDHYYLEGSIPDDPLLLSVITAVSQEDFDLEWPAVRGWFEPRMDGRMTPRARAGEQPKERRPARAKDKQLILAAGPSRTSEDEQRGWFEAWWAEYWLHRGKLPAWKSYLRAVTTPKKAETVLRAMLIQKPAMMQREPDKRPHAATWINQERWTDEVDPARVEVNPNEIYYPELP